MQMVDIKPGDKIRFFYGEGNVSNELVHIRAIVDDEYIVFRYWRYSKRRWGYRVEHWYYFEVSKEHWTKA